MSPTIVLLITRPGVIQDGLRALLMATRLVHSIVLADGLLPEQTIKDVHPALMIIEDGLLKDKTHRLLQMTRTLSPESRRFVIVETVVRRQAFNASEAEAILLQGTPAVELAGTIEKLLSQTSLDDLA